MRLFAAAAAVLPGSATVLYPGSFVDIGPSVWFDDVAYVDTDRRAARFFARPGGVARLVTAKRIAAGAPPGPGPEMRFHGMDYRTRLPVADGSIDLLISLYAGFVSEHCARYLRPGGLLLANNSHGDASLSVARPPLRAVRRHHRPRRPLPRRHGGSCRLPRSEARIPPDRR